MSHTAHWYRVTLHYREPSFEAQRGAQPRPYRGTFLVQAPTTESAVRVARCRFDAWTRASSVGWVRIVVATDCEALPSTEALAHASALSPALAAPPPDGWR